MRITIPRSRRLRYAAPIALGTALLLGPVGCGAPQESGPADEAGPAPSPPAAAQESAPPPRPPATGLPEVDPGVPSSLPDDVPVPSGATAHHQPFENLGATRAAFRLEDSPAEVRSWYQQALRDGGWELSQEREVGSDWLLAARKDDRMLTIAITGAGEFTNLMLVEHRVGS